MNRRTIVLVWTLIALGLSGCGKDTSTMPEGENGKTITVDLPGGATMEMAWIEPGTFAMGSSEDELGRHNSEGPQHQVTISQGFHLGKHEITLRQWERVMGTRPWEGRDHVVEHPNSPAVCISWEDVQAFIRTLNEAEDLEVYRLPTEAEWEYACRARTTTPWSFGDDESQLGEYAWYWGNAENVEEDYAHVVGTRLPNAWGLYDMHGNVWEWVQDWYSTDYYRASSSLDPPGPDSGSHRVLRGGAFHLYAHDLRSAQRYLGTPDHSANNAGTRLLRQEP